MKFHLLLDELHRSEDELTRALLTMADHHRADHETFHVARDLAAWSAGHLRLLAPAGKEFGLDLTPSEEPVALTRDWLGHREPSVLLLADFRHLYRLAAGVSVDWELLAQAAQGARRADLLSLAEHCHPQTLRQLRWANARLKDSATQALVS
ncbi:hypothetical protein [Herbidospora yilanensis]|uniref:hypothetical protein n=1 Tax=Herbidospora yilanensis TaxID=354426 RepID=UPI0007805FBB|nr:hypothetical protein [Herbidospora yilanensis]